MGYLRKLVLVSVEFKTQLTPFKFIHRLSHTYVFRNILMKLISFTCKNLNLKDINLRYCVTVI